MKSGLHVKAINLSDKCLHYAVSFDRIATVETERVHSICSWTVQRESETKCYGRIVNSKDYKAIICKIKMTI